MKSREEILSSAKNTLLTESRAIEQLVDYLNADFADLVETIFKLKGRVIVTGIGKSAIIGQKIVATLNSTGTPAIFMHAGEAIHGDLGIIQRDDLVLCISKSGNTPEIKVLIPLLKQGNNPIASIVGDTNSYLAKQSDFIINATIEAEACPLNLAPTTSTTAQLVIGDALAICLLELRRFTSRDFAKFHPGGALGKRLYLKVRDLSSQNEKPQIEPEDDIRKVILEITKKRLGITAVVEQNEVKGVITDGDLRRMMEKFTYFDKLSAKDIMSSNPKTIQGDELAVNALKIMKENNITQIVVVDKLEKYQGIIHLHDLLKEGII
ncbi:KpsF/GutQ family protein [Pseudopedobacter saltans DSM 12145]|uniref:KpsF/GutQ family protein n=1 Tax=Pseudopedobacter saltans (strain ATCC 51119 / DSM 12145 / JCM 21818 / CCUG 39354 / LMG 10337 / NBRC 100064 / NCIMB 13643) TaxID=762903 RepID=F0SAZ9_PSESL|nr:KpsF/GutQ family sugar-phosphate isomerase [Pseudopedobacter saltans]ADY51594.1 KpsF/GutQ family protein [Pseudopedobacter saltans DSM 12145]